MKISEMMLPEFDQEMANTLRPEEPQGTARRIR